MKCPVGATGAGEAIVSSGIIGIRWRKREPIPSHRHPFGTIPAQAGTHFAAACALE
jgi:hypothetical protein